MARGSVLLRGEGAADRGFECGCPRCSILISWDLLPSFCGRLDDAAVIPWAAALSQRIMECSKRGTIDNAPEANRHSFSSPLRPTVRLLPFLFPLITPAAWNGGSCRFRVDSPHEFSGPGVQRNCFPCPSLSTEHHQSNSDANCSDTGSGSAPRPVKNALTASSDCALRRSPTGTDEPGSTRPSAAMGARTGYGRNSMCLWKAFRGGNTDVLQPNAQHKRLAGQPRKRDRPYGNITTGPTKSKTGLSIPADMSGHTSMPYSFTLVCKVL